MKIAILSKDTEYAKMLEYELSDRGYCVFGMDWSTNADVVVCDTDSVNIANIAFAGSRLITFSRSNGAALKRPFAISTLCELISYCENNAPTEILLPVIDMRKRKLIYSAKEINLSPLEARLYNELASAKGETVETERLLPLFQSQGDGGADRIRVLVNSLRRKIRQAFSLDIIENVRGKGYRIKH